MFQFALRNLFGHKLRSGMTFGAIFFGVISLVLSGGFIEGMFIQLREAVIHSQFGHIQINAQGFFEKGARAPDRFMIDDADPLRQKIVALPEVSDVMARVSFSGLLNTGRTDRSIVGEGIEPNRENKLGTFIRIESGRSLNDQDRYSIMVGKGLADAFKIGVGDRVTVLVSTSGGALNTLEFDVVGTFRSFSRDYDARTVRVPLAAAQELLNAKGVNTLVVSLRDTLDTARVAELLAGQLDPAKFEVKKWNEMTDFYDKTVTLYDRQFGVLRLIVLIMVFLGVANSVNMSAFERVGEFGTMMALGNRRRDVFRLVIMENVLIGVFGSAAGVLIGVALALVISAIGIPMPPPPSSEVGYMAQIRVVPKELMLAFAVGFLATVTAAVFPARRVTRIPVVDALRQNV
ncbi:ABC transporter permease [Propionivibrio sp.]|uniref:ABC transporter permease n=1 Tax=Propionivibrio sp. TaxID=2212460 RepID=UPI003BF33E96